LVPDGDRSPLGGELRTAEQGLATVDATLEQRREVLETAMRFAADCAPSHRKTRRLFNQAVLDRIEVCDRKLASVSYQAPFDLLFSMSKFEYDAVVAPTYPYANRVPLVEGPTIRLARMHTRAQVPKSGPPA
jgi:hypothetical protein